MQIGYYRMIIGKYKAIRRLIKTIKTGYAIKELWVLKSAVTKHKNVENHCFYWHIYSYKKTQLYILLHIFPKSRK